MAEGWLRHLAGDHFDVHSAGIEARGVHPLAIQVMQEVGIDISHQRSKNVREYLGHKHFGYLITVCSQAEANCPTTFPGVGRRLHWHFDDPAACKGTEAECLDAFRKVRDEIEHQIRIWLGLWDIHPTTTPEGQ